PKPAHQRPESPEFWDKRFAEGVTPWDHGSAPDELEHLVPPAGGETPPRILVPGCGHAREAAWLDAHGWKVTALDFSPAAIDAARATLGEWGGELRCADFFDFPLDRPYDVVYERAFLCALPRKLWPGYGHRLAEVVRPGGYLAGFFFFSDEPKGPPFGIGAAELETMLSPWFERIADAPAQDSVPVFAGKERWQVWRRR
ncbi:MAG TPA: methyltransferase domain-containing protein, partial [Azospira sp.]|nr:methyltransferase domain-containing protein [Azospira sp.]